MKIKIFLFSICCGLLLNSCEKEIIPLANFEHDFAIDYNSLLYYTINVPKYATFEDIKFINTSKNAVKYSWNFGDGQVSEKKEPIIQYHQGGVYTVTLIVESESGNTSTYTSQINILERVLDKISILFQGWDHNLYTLDELGWTDNKISDIIIVFSKKDLVSQDYVNPKEVLFTSDTIRNVSLENRNFTIYPDKDIIIDYNVLDNKTNFFYMFQLYAVHGKERQLFYSSGFIGLGFYHDYESGLFILGPDPTISCECIYK
jgi:hypothetical protein